MEFAPENVSDVLLCPVCFHISKDKVFQCKGGHIICDECYGKLTTCPQCRVPLGSEPIRNRITEHLLDELKVDCPYEGCQEVLNRKSFHEHVRSCVAKFGQPVNVCKLLGYTTCNYKIHQGNMKDAIEHFEFEHNVIVEDSDTLELPPDQLIILAGGPALADSTFRYVEPIILHNKDEGIAFLLNIVFTANKTILFSCYTMDYSPERKRELPKRVAFSVTGTLDGGEGKQHMFWGMSSENILNMGQFPYENFHTLILITPMVEKLARSNGAKMIFSSD